MDFAIGCLVTIALILIFGIAGSVDYASEQAYAQAWAVQNGVGYEVG